MVSHLPPFTPISPAPKRSPSPFSLLPEPLLPSLDSDSDSWRSNSVSPPPKSPSPSSLQPEPMLPSLDSDSDSWRSNSVSPGPTRSPSPFSLLPEPLIPPSPILPSPIKTPELMDALIEGLSLEDKAREQADTQRPATPMHDHKRIRQEDSTVQMGGGGFSKPSFKIPFRDHLTKDDTHTRLFGPYPQHSHFNQQNIGDCYFLAALRAMLDHSEHDRILRMIQIQEVLGMHGWPVQYRVMFPTGKTVEVDAAELGKERCGKKPVSGSLGVQLLELAYGKMIRQARNADLAEPYQNEGRGQTPKLMEGGFGHQALHDMLGGDIKKFSCLDTAPPSVPSDFSKPLSQHAGSVQKLEAFLTEIKNDSKHDYLLIAATPNTLPSWMNGEQGGADNPNVIQLPKSHVPFSTQRWFYRAHAYSVRDFDPKQRTIKVVNPHDTKDQVHTMFLEAFCHAFQCIEGIRLPKPPEPKTAAQPG